MAARRECRPSRNPRCATSRSLALEALVPAVAGVCLALTLPPLGWWPLGPAGAALLATAIHRRNWRSRLKAGLLTGLGLFVPGLAWMSAFTVPGYVLAVILEAGFVAVAVVAVPPGRGRLLALPAALTLAEAARGRWPLGGLPLAGPALGQASGPLAPVASRGGSLALVALAAAAGTALAGLAVGATGRRRAAIGAIATLAGSAASIVAASHSQPADPLAP
jgi:apolipoprotein N-acyltransferase